MLIQNAYLPTMSEDILQEVRQAGGTFYGALVNLEDYYSSCISTTVCRMPQWSPLSSWRGEFFLSILTRIK